MDCIFCKIVNKEISTEIIYEDDEILVFKDIHPLAKIHWLIIPKIHFSSLKDAPNQEILGSLMWKIKQLALDQGLVKKGYKVIINTGEQAGQVINHFHAHFLSDEDLRTKNLNI